MSRKYVREFYRKTWVKPREGAQYVCGADVGGGGPQSQSASCAYMCDVQTGEYVAVLYGWWDFGGFADRLHDFAVDYNKAFLGIENNMGYAVLMRLMDHYAYENLYFYREPLAKPGTAQYVPGFNVNSTTRKFILDNLAAGLRDKSITIYDPAFFAEAATFQWAHKSGSRARPEALGGKLDDRIMSAAITFQMLLERPYEAPRPDTDPKTVDEWHHKRQLAAALLQDLAQHAAETGTFDDLYVTGASKADKLLAVFKDEEHPWLDELAPFLR